MRRFGRYGKLFTLSVSGTIAESILTLGAGVGIGSVFAALITGVARNPALRSQSLLPRTSPDLEADHCCSPAIPIRHSRVRLCRSSRSLQSDVGVHPSLRILGLSGVQGLWAVYDKRIGGKDEKRVYLHSIYPKAMQCPAHVKVQITLDCLDGGV